MFIDSIQCIPVEMGVKPLSEDTGLVPYIRSNRGRNIDTKEQYEIYTRKRMLIQLQTNEGITGWGELLVTMKSVQATTSIIEDVIAPKIEGSQSAISNHSSIRSIIRI